ncbi:MAG: winged helix-turn-helix transcriptional regulator [Chloroflexi bacterium]|nr:winged helix-turn-helix transcriptional regulator [Chloroflexota bacterium]
MADGAGLGDHPPQSEYCLTKKGQELSAVVRTISEWGFTYELDDDTGRQAKEHAKARPTLAAQRGQ